VVLNAVDRNDWETRCVRCQALVYEKMGDLFHPPGYQPYTTCGVCALYEGMNSPDHMDVVMRSFPRPDVFGGLSLSPYGYQAADAIQLAQVRSHLLNNQQGTGKTPTLLLSLDPSMGHMIWCPSPLTGNWLREGERWRPDLEFVVMRSKKSWRLPEVGEVVIASFGLLPGEPCGACKANGWRACAHREDQANPIPVVSGAMTMSCDEIQFLQNKTARRRRWDLLADAVWEAGGYLRGLTGTSISNKPDDIREILRCLKLSRAAFYGPEGVKATHRDIYWRWYDFSKGKRGPPQGIERDRLLKRLRPVRQSRLRKHVLKHLPPVVRKPPVLVKLDAKTMAEVDEAIQRLFATRRTWEDVKEGLLEDPWGNWKNGERKRQKLSDQEKGRRGALFAKRVQMHFETRPEYTDAELQEAVAEALESKGEVPTIGELSKIRKVISLAKVSAALELVQQQEDRDEPTIVFCQHVDVLERLFEGREGWGIYTGRVTLKKRDLLYQAFQRGEVKRGLGISILSGAEGLNLTRASSMVFIDEFWNPAKNNQCTDRLNRPGAEIHDQITIWKLQADHAVDRLVTLTVNEKSALAESIEDDEWSQRGLVA
jgi:hypothetical protein